MMTKRVIVCSLVVAAVLAACGVPTSSTPVKVPQKDGVTTTGGLGLASPVVPPVRVFFLRNGKFSALERQGNDSPNQPERGVQEALDFLRNGVFSGEESSGFSSPIQAMDEVDIPVIVRDGIAQINLTAQLGALRQLPSDTVQQIIGQIALTALLGSPGVGAVTFEADGQFLELRVNGQTRVPPFHLDDFDCLDGTARCSLPAVQLPELASAEPDAPPTSAPIDTGPVPEDPIATVPQTTP
jgi:Sporulation and spore germination